MARSGRAGGRHLRRNQRRRAERPDYIRTACIEEVGLLDLLFRRMAADSGPLTIVGGGGRCQQEHRAPGRDPAAAAVRSMRQQLTAFLELLSRAMFFGLLINYTTYHIYIQYICWIASYHMNYIMK